MHDVALPVLTRWRVPELIRERNVRAAEHIALLRKLKHARHKNAWWERAVFGDATDAARIRELEEATERAWTAITKADREATAAISAAANEHLPIEMVWRVEQIVASVLYDPSVGRVRCEREAELIALLDALANRVASLWLTDYSPEHLGHAIAHMMRSELAAPGERLRELRTDERLGWAAIPIHELVTRATAELASGPAVAARARLQKESAGHERVTHALKAARESLGLDERLWPGRIADKDRVAGWQRTLEKEYAELIGASELLSSEVERALSAFPPFGIYLAATASACVMRAGIENPEWMLEPSGECTRGPSARPRALVLASLIELRRAVDIAFPDLSALFAGRGAMKKKSTGVYRERAEPKDGEDQAQPLTGDETDTRLFDAIERSGASEQIERSLRHAIALGAMRRTADRPSSDVGWAVALSFWSPGEQSPERLNQRRAWHLEMVSWLLYDIDMRVDQAAGVLPGFRMRNHVMNCHRTMTSLGTIVGSVSPDTICPVLNREEALQSLRDAATSLGRTWGLSGTKEELSRQVAHHLHTVPVSPNPVVAGSPSRVLSQAEVVLMVAEALRSTDFLQREARLRAAPAAHSQATAARLAAWSQVSGWDELNILWETPAEAALERSRNEIAHLELVVREDHARINEMLDRALALYPPAHAYFSLVAVQARVQTLRAVLVGAETSYRCSIDKYPALQALRDWTAQALLVFGHLPSNGELMASFVARELTPLNGEENP